MASNSMKQMLLSSILNHDTDTEMSISQDVALLSVLATPFNISQATCVDASTRNEPGSKIEDDQMDEDEEIREPVEWSTPCTRRALDHIPPPLLHLAPAGPPPIRRSVFPGITPTIHTANRKTIAIRKILTARRKPLSKRVKRVSIIDLTVDDDQEITSMMSTASRKTIATQKMLPARHKSLQPLKKRISIIDLTADTYQCFHCLKVFNTVELREGHMCGSRRQFRCSHPGCIRSRDCGFRYRWERDGHAKEAHGVSFV